MTKDEIIAGLLGSTFTFYGKKCKMVRAYGSAGHIWIIKSGFFGEKITRADKLTKAQLLVLYSQRNN